MAFTIGSICGKKATGTACGAEEPQEAKKRSPYLLPNGLFRLLLVGGAFIWNRALLSASDSGATVASYHGKTKEQLQAELDKPPQRFADIQNDRTLFRSGGVKPGEGVGFCGGINHAMAPTGERDPALPEGVLVAVGCAAVLAGAT